MSETIMAEGINAYGIDISTHALENALSELKIGLLLAPLLRSLLVMKNLM